MKTLVSLLLTILLLIGCTSTGSAQKATAAPPSPAADYKALTLTEGGRRWWHDAIVYGIWPRSFKDSDGDGNAWVLQAHGQGRNTWVVINLDPAKPANLDVPAALRGERLEQLSGEKKHSRNARRSKQEKPGCSERPSKGPITPCPA